MNRPSRKPKGWEHLFEVPGVAWEDQVEGMKAIHVTIKGSKHIVVYAYHKSSEFNVCTYYENQFTDSGDDQWMGPMEALCIILEALKDSSSTLQTSKLGT